jgi:hypothetical protein
MALSISAGNGDITSQKNTQTPQASVGPASKATPSGSVQPGTATSLLSTTTGGISLTNQTLPTVTVGAASASTGQVTPSKPIPAKHHFNPVLLGLAIVLLAAALAFFWIITRSAKNTTD